MPSVKDLIDRTQDVTFNWTGGVPNTQVTILGGSDVNGVNVAFLCAAPVSAGQMTIPSYVWLNLPPTGSSLGPGQLTVENSAVSLFKASGLDFGTVRYSVGFTLYLKYQ